MRQAQLRDSLAGMSKSCSGLVLPSSLSAGWLLSAWLKVSCTLPRKGLSVWLDTLTVNSTVSPSRRNRGGFGCTMRSLAVTAWSSRQPLRTDWSWAKPRNRHFVSASGMVKVIRTTPLESEVNCGKKNAVSFRFLRAATLLKSGFGAAGCLVAPPAPPASCLSKRASSCLSRSHARYHRKHGRCAPAP